VYNVEKIIWGWISMKANEAVRTIMEKQGVGLSQLAKRTEKSPRLVSDRLRMENISLDKLNELLRVLDYKIVIVPHNKPISEDKGEFVIE